MYDSILSEFLKQQAFKEIELRQTNVGHFELIVTLNGVDANFLVDTGAAGTVIDIDLANKHELFLNETDFKGGGVGTSELTVFQLEVSELRMGDFSLENVTIHAIDFTHIKESLLMKGETQLPDGILGADILIPHKAIIDCGSGYLYLKNDIE